MVLSNGEKGFTYTVNHIELDTKIKRRLQMLGLTHGTQIFVLNKKKSGPMIVKVRGTRFAIGKGFLEGIFVED